MTLDPSDYCLKKPITYHPNTGTDVIVIEAKQFVEIVISANQYLAALKRLTTALGFDLYDELEQRNVSGFVGEVFSRFFSRGIEVFKFNPHADGRPDLLDVSTAEAMRHLENQCHRRTRSGDLMPLRQLLAPFKYGGIEVKATIGTPVARYKQQLKDSIGTNNFRVGMSRLEYLDSITFWGHHKDCSSLLGLYYDFCSELQGAPQVMAAMYSELDTATDWYEVSIGKAGSKKTSNTSLGPRGRAKLNAGVVVVTTRPRYIERLRASGLAV
jgi:hypothetical protein